MRGTKTTQDLISRCLELRRQGCSLNEIVESLGISKTTAYKHIKHIALPPGRVHAATEKRRQFFIALNSARLGRSKPNNRVNRIPSWSPELVRVIGHFTFDGSINYYGVSYYNRSIQLTVSQESDVLELFGMRARIRQVESGVIHVIYRSVDFAALISGFRRELDLLLPHAPIAWKRSYLKAFFDDEGNVYMSRIGQDRKVRGYQYANDVLITVQKLLADFQIDSALDLKAHAVVIRGCENLKRFALEINFSPGLSLNPLRSNSIYGSVTNKRDLLARIIASYSSQ